MISSGCCGVGACCGGVYEVFKVLISCVGTVVNFVVMWRLPG